MKKVKHLIFSLFFLMIGLAGCRKLIAVDSPVNQLTKDKIFIDSASTIALLDNTYALFNQNIDGTYTPEMGYYSDELTYTSTNAGTIEFLKSTVSPANSANFNIWSRNYFAIYECNDIIEGLNSYNGIKPATKLEFISEVKFLRAYAYFYLTNLYGAVPLILETDVNKTATAAKADSATIYKQIIQDLNDAQTGLAEAYTGSGKVRANKWAATALLARVYLYQKRYAEAEQTAAAVINSGLYTPLESPASVFLSGSKESILQFYTQYGYTAEGALLVPGSGKPSYPLTNALLSSFETGDLRKIAWTNKSTVTSGGTITTYYYPYKYHNRSTNTGAPEYLTALRISEQYLIRAEARLQQNNISGAVDDLNIIRQRAGLLPLANSISSSACLDALIHERQVELFVEWGNRFLDLKRIGRINAVMGAFKTTWKSTAALLPIPQSEIATDPNLTQNPGY
ncbi:RagB/SusD family nutrient uptake outer membrane protein [Mucilaginibacter flavidus]|uniref:RagB/SusD family nutrient uptake outer membrane protein n=1 Tax=Mucilaginibacter flavidus TaxID=2949309 RepID=UPI002091F19E|nr:RagB/SusD family nutrient uptake outer membrane protein [Mucilaginibacter flavidus]MCO5947931.1 RagB/SusD family nutrient uptake outer membrane protein [Mucilaginibacter flavidus]